MSWSPQIFDLVARLEHGVFFMSGPEMVFAFRLAEEKWAANGDKWLKAHASLALAAPRAIVPREKSYLINPSHADFRMLTQTAEPLTFQAG